MLVIYVCVQNFLSPFKLQKLTEIFVVEIIFYLGFVLNDLASQRMRGREVQIREIDGTRMVKKKKRWVFVDAG